MLLFYSSFNQMRCAETYTVDIFYRGVSGFIHADEGGSHNFILTKKGVM